MLTNRCKTVPQYTVLLPEQVCGPALLCFRLRVKKVLWTLFDQAGAALSEGV